MIVHFSTIQTMALAVIVFYLGKFLNNNLNFLKIIVFQIQLLEELYSLSLSY